MRSVTGTGRRAIAPWLMACVLMACVLMAQGCAVDAPDANSEAVEPAGLQLSEVHVSPGRGDRFEVVNLGAEPIELTGWQVQGGARKQPWTLPAGLLEPGEYRSFELVGAAFGLARTDELLLFAPDGRPVDAMSWTATDLGNADCFGRLAGGGEGALAHATPHEPNAGPCTGACAVEETGGIDLFDAGVVELRLELDPESQVELAGYREERKTGWVRGLVHWQDQAFKARIRLRGNAYIDDWMMFAQFHVKLSRGRRASGHRRILLDRGRSPRQHLHNTLAMSAMRLAGLVAPRTAPVRLFLGETRLGLYEAIEPLDETFVRQHFPRVVGNLHKGSELQHRDRGADSSGHAALQLGLWDAWKRDDSEAFSRLVEGAFDMDQLLRLFAVEVAIGAEENCGADGLFTENCALLMTEQGIITIPWDQDENLHPDAPVGHRAEHRADFGPNVLRALIDDPIWNARFECELLDVANTVLGPLADVVDTECALVADDLKADGVNPEQKCAELRQSIERRAAEIRARSGCSRR